MRRGYRILRIREKIKDDMKVLYVNSVAGNGSTGRMTEDLARMQESLICYGRGTYRGDVPSFRFTEFSGNAIAALNTILFNRNGLSNRKETGKLIRRIEQFAPDLIHLHNLHGYYVNYEELFDWLKDAGIPVVWTLHDCWSFTGYCPHFEGCGCTQYRTICETCPYPFAYPFSLFRQNVREQFLKKRECFTSVKRLTLVTPSDWLRERVLESFLKEKPVKTIHNGIDLSVFHPCAEKQDGFSVLFVSGSWTKEKGSEDMHALLAEMDPSISVTVIGNGSGQFEKYANVKVLKRTGDRKELAEYYSRADFLVNLTLEDTFPTVNMEALACGTPVITYRSGGSPEIVDDKTGIVIEKHDLSALRTVLAREKKNRSFRSQDCRRRAETCFDQIKTLQQYQNLYAACVEGRE